MAVYTNIPASATSVGPSSYTNIPASGGPALTNLVQWLEADSGLNLAAGTWTDKSGNGNSCTSKVGSPTLNASSLNGLPGITLDGASYLRSTTANPLANGAAREVYFVIKPSGAGAGLFASWHISSPSWIPDGRVTGADSFSYDDGAAAVSKITGFNYAAAGYVVNYQSTVGSLPVVTINGVLQTSTGSVVTSDTGSTGFTLGCYYGGALGLVGDFVGVLLYNGVQSAGDRTTTTAFLRGKYGV